MKRVLTLGLAVLTIVFARDNVANGQNTFAARNVAIVDGALEPCRSGELVFSDDFQDASLWNLRNYRDLLEFRFGVELRGRRCLVISREKALDEQSDSPHDTAWALTRALTALPSSRTASEFTLRLTTIGALNYEGKGFDGPSWRGSINWYDAEKSPIDSTPTLFRAATQWNEFTYTGAIPDAARYYELQIGCDAPNIEPGDYLALARVALEMVDSQRPYCNDGEFISDVFSGGAFTWDAATPQGTSVKFQVASTTVDAQGELGEFTPFVGPDGTVDSYYTEPFEVNSDLAIRYRVILTPGATEAPRLLSVRIDDFPVWSVGLHLASSPAEVRLLGDYAQPSRERNAPIRFEISDNTVLRHRSIRVALDDVEVTNRLRYDIRTLRNAQLRFVAPEPLSEGLHRLDIDVENIHENTSHATRYFYVGDAPTTPLVTLRNDGATLIDGEPFFPIGIYGVCKREFNHFDIDEAFKGLRQAGFNFAHSYSMPREDEFLQAAEKYGFKLWSVARFPDERFVEVERHCPAIIAWYLADDTCANTTVSELSDYHQSVKAVDPTRLTVQADPIAAESIVSNYAPYVKGTDAYLPEIYPVRKEGEGSGDRCVAQTIRDVVRARSDAQNANDGPKAIWPIIQYFQGWGWERFPTNEELRAMSFGALAAGGNGITWYTYGGFVEPEKKKFNYGVTTTPERWNNISTLATQINEISPALLEVTQEELQPELEIVAGPQQNLLGEPSVVYLLKRHEEYNYLLVVNSVREQTSVKFRLREAPRCESPEILWQDANVAPCKFDANVLVDTLGPFGVRVYRWK